MSSTKLFVSGLSNVPRPINIFLINMTNHTFVEVVVLHSSRTI